jgi:hypothetical protein
MSQHVPPSRRLFLAAGSSGARVAAKKRPAWAKRMIAALEGSGLAESDLERVVGARHSWVARWLEGANVRSSREIDALIAVSVATEVSMNWIVIGKETNALWDKARVAQIRGRLRREPVVEIETARAVMRPDKQTICL